MTAKQRSSKGLVLFSIIILSLIGILCIINLSVNQGLNWSLYPIGALVLVWAILAPISLPGYKLLGSYMGLSITLIPYLYLIAHLSGDGAWFWPLAFPLALSFLGAAGIFLVFFYRLKNQWQIVAAAFFLFGVVFNSVTGEIIRHYLADQNIKDQIINRSTIYSFILLTFLSVLVGYQKRDK